MNILVVFYSTYGHLFKMAEAVAEGARQIEGAVVQMKRVQETLPLEILKDIGAYDAQKVFEHIPVATIEDLEWADAVVFGTPTRFGNMASQMKHFLDSTGSLWAKGSLVGKLGSVFTSTATQHGGQEATILSFHTTLLHQGMIIAGLPYSFAGQTTMDAISGCSPYGASTITGGEGERMPSENELDGARFQGRYVAGIAAKLTKK